METSPVLKLQHQQAQRELLRHKKSNKNQATVKATHKVMRLGATNFALPAVLLLLIKRCSKVRDNHLYRKICVSYVNNICNGKKFCYVIKKLKPKYIYKAIKSL